MDAVVLAAGEGRRMRPLTARRPKVMLPVAGRPILEHVLLAARAVGAGAAHLVVHYHREAVETHVGNGAAFGLAITYHAQGEPRGTGHALAAVRPRPTHPFLLLSGDTLVGAADLERLIDRHRATGRAVMGVFNVPDASAYGAVETHDGRLVRIHEKSPTPPTSLINSGVYLLTPAVFAHLDALTESPRGELELTDAVEALAREEGVEVIPLETWRDVGRPWHLLDANEEMLRNLPDDDAYWRIDGDVEPGCTIRGPVRIEAGAVVRAGTCIDGPVVIQRDARVGPLAYLRACTVVGPRCHVGAHTETKNSILLPDSNVPHLNYVGDSVLGSGVNLGAGTKVANLRHDKAEIDVHVGPGEKIGSGRRKMGVILGDGVKTGINVSLDCGTVVGADALLAPGMSFHGHLRGATLHWGDGRTRRLNDKP